jgi:hypothetical protein
MTVDSPKVFISYAHESEAHREQVLALATFLRETGIDTTLDVWSADTRRDWYSWAIQEMTAADFVLVVASAQYRSTGDGAITKHRGVQSEAALLRELLYSDRLTWLPKILPVILPGHTVAQVPLFLQPHTASHFPVTSFDTTGAALLLQVLLHRSTDEMPEVPAEQEPGIPPVPDAELETPSEHAAPARLINQINGTIIGGKIIQTDSITGNIIL